MRHKIWWVLAGDNYYPDRDNFVKSFYTKEEADKWVTLEQNHDHSKDWYKIVYVGNRLIDDPE